MISWTGFRKKKSNFSNQWLIMCGSNDAIIAYCDSEKAADTVLYHLQQFILQDWTKLVNNRS